MFSTIIIQFYCITWKLICQVGLPTKTTQLIVPRAAMNSEVATPEGKRSRKANWSAEDTLLLVQMYQQHSKVFRSSFDQLGSSKKSKTSAWLTISQAVSEQSGIPRNIRDCQKRWQTVQSESRKRLAKHKEALTGTGKGKNNSSV